MHKMFILFPIGGVKNKFVHPNGWMYIYSNHTSNKNNVNVLPQFLFINTGIDNN